MSRAEALDISPWATWLLFALILHERRQQWVGEVVTQKLGGDLQAISSRGAFGHPLSGDLDLCLVPGDVEWEYRFHGCGCCLTHRVTGERIDVDFHDGSAEWIDSYFYQHFLESLTEPRFIELRLLALHPCTETLVLSFEELADAGLLQRLDASRVMRLAPECRQWMDKVNQLEAMKPQPATCIRVGCALDDWLMVRDAGFDSPIAREGLGKSLQRCRQRLARLFAAPETRRPALRALVELGDQDAIPALTDALNDSPCGTGSAVMEILEARPSEDWSESVLQLLRRTNPNGQVPEPYLWLACAQYLLRRNPQNSEVRAALGHMHKRELGLAALLALEHAPEHAIELFRRALRSSVPNDRSLAAAALAILDQPWARAQLLAVLDECDDQACTAECRAALLAMPDPALHAAVQRWESQNPHEPALGRFITIADAMLQSRNEWMSFKIAELSDRVLPLRKVIPPGPAI